MARFRGSHAIWLLLGLLMVASGCSDTAGGAGSDLGGNAGTGSGGNAGTGGAGGLASPDAGAPDSAMLPVDAGGQSHPDAPISGTACLALPEPGADWLNTDGGVPDGGAADGGDIPPLAACPPSELPPVPLRHLSNAEYRRTVQDMLGVAADDLDLPPDMLEDDFENRAARQHPSPMAIEAWAKAARLLAARWAGCPKGLAACNGTQGDETTCARNLLSSVGAALFRRPLSAAELDRWQALYAHARPALGHVASVRLAVEGMLQAPAFLYRLEVGQPGAAQPVPLTGHEIASRLSYLIWGSGPDGRLAQLASSGALEDPQMRVVIAAAMLRDPRARFGLPEFARQWLQIDRILYAQKDTARFPSFDAARRAALRTEALDFITKTLLGEGGGTLADLLTDPTGPQEEGRPGILGLPTFLATNAGARHSSPISRGRFIRERLLCGHLPAPPPDANFQIQEDDSKTTRERTEEATGASADCHGCHRLMDPLGYAFEHFDAVGARRATENGRPIDASGEIVGTASDGPFDGSLQLADKLARGGPDAHACAVQWFYRWMVGRNNNLDPDRCEVGALSDGFMQVGGDFSQLLRLVVARDAFVMRARNVAPLPIPSQPSGQLTDADPRMVHRVLLDFLLADYRVTAEAHESEDRRKLEAHVVGLRELERRLAVRP